MDVKGKLKILAIKHLKAFGQEAVGVVARPLVEQKIKESKNKLDDTFLPFLDQIETAAVSLIGSAGGEEEVEPAA